MIWKIYLGALSLYIIYIIFFRNAIYIYIYIYIYKTNFIVCDRCEHQKITYFSIQIYFGTVFLRQCMFLCEDTYWKFSIFYKLTIKELSKLTKGITWRHSNIVLKLEKMKFTNTLKNNVQLREEINSTKGTKQLQNKKTNIKYKNGLPITIDKQG